MMHDARSPADRRLLFVLPHVPGLDAPSGGARVSGHLIAGLARRHAVAVLCLRRRHDPAPDARLRRLCESYEEFGVWEGESQRLRRARHEAAMVLGTPRWARRADVAACRQRLRSLAAEWRPDVVHLGYHVMGQYATELAACAAPRVLIEYEPGVTAARDGATGTRTLGLVRDWLEVRAWSRFEQRVIRQANAVVVFTERDRQALAPLAGAVPMVCIPPGIVIPSRALDPLGTPPPSVVFVGNFAHGPNVDAAVRLAYSIFPRVRRVRPDAQLLLVGAGASGRIRALAGDGVTVTGAVESVVPHLDAAAVVVAPLRHGGGMRLKVMEALAAGKAVIASPLAAEGMDVTDRRELLVAVSDEAFVSAIVRLLDDVAGRGALGRRARDWARTHLAWDRTIAAYESLHAELVRTPVARRYAGAAGAERALSA